MFTHKDEKLIPLYFRLVQQFGTPFDLATNQAMNPAASLEF